MADIFSGTVGGLTDLLGSDEAPKAVLNQYSAPTISAGGKLTTDLLGDTNKLSKSALDTYLAAQPKMQQLAGQQENTLQGLLARRLNSDPTALLKSVGDTAYGFINPNVVNPLSQFDVNSNILSRRAHGLNPAAVDSTSERLRNARIASQRYYDVANQVNQNLPNLYGQAFQQNQANENAAAGYIPQIQQSYESVAARPTTGLANRINTAGAAEGVGGQHIANVNAATQGFHQHRNIADRIGAANQTISEGVHGTMNDIGQMIGGASQMAGGM
jgi:hypothetical protein